MKSLQAKTHIFGCVWILLICFGVICESTIYVSPNGNDSNSGTSKQSALKSLQSGIDKAKQNNDELVLLDGKYVQNNDLTVGGITQPLVIRADNPLQATVATFNRNLVIKDCTGSVEWRDIVFTNTSLSINNNDLIKFDGCSWEDCFVNAPYNVTKKIINNSELQFVDCSFLLSTSSFSFTDCDVSFQNCQYYQKQQCDVYPLEQGISFTTSNSSFQNCTIANFPNFQFLSAKIPLQTTEPYQFTFDQCTFNNTNRGISIYLDTSDPVLVENPPHTVSFSSCTFVNMEGAAYDTSGGSLIPTTFDHCTFSDLTNYKIISYSSTGTVSINNTIFQHSNSQGISIASWSSLIIENTLFDDISSAEEFSSAVLEVTCGNNEYIVRNVTLQNCQTSRSLVAMESYAENSTVYLDNIKILDNAVTEGTMLYFSGSYFNIFLDDFLMDGNSVKIASTNSGAFYASYPGLLSITDAVFDHNNVKGTLMYADVDNVQLTDVAISNHKPGLGEIPFYNYVYSGFQSAFTFTRVNITNSEANTGVTFAECNATFVSCLFSGNSGGQSSHIAATGSHIDIINTIFQDSPNTGISLLQTSGSIQNCTFDRHTGVNGGAMLIQGGRVTISNSAFTGNSATYGSVLYQGVESWVAFFNTTITGCSGFQGGCLFLTEYGTLVVTDVVIKDAVVTASGAAIYSSSAALKLTRVTFQNCTASSDGGAVWVQQAAVTLKNVAFIATESLGGGGAISLNSGVNASFTSVTFDQCSAFQGGSVLASNLGTGNRLYMTGCSFQDSSSTLQGGAIQIQQSTLYMVNTNIRDGSSLSGGAIAAVLATVTVQSSLITNCTGYDRGGAVFLSNSQMDILSTSFIMNSAQDSGGIFSQISTVHITNSLFDSNSAPSHSAMYILDSDLVVEDTVFNGHYGSYRVIEITQANVVPQEDAVISYFENCSFTGNSGSALRFATSIGSSIVNGCTFNDNSCVDGCGIYLEETADVYITHSSFSHNDADNSGGAVYFSTNTARNFTIDNCAFSSNIAMYGGAVALYPARFTSTQVFIRNNIFTGNYAHYGAGVYIENNPVDMWIEDCSFEENNCHIYGGAIHSGLSGTPLRAGKLHVYRSSFVANLATWVGLTSPRRAASEDWGDGYGAAVGCTWGLVDIDDCSFDSGMAGIAGGAIATDEYCQLNISDSVLRNNTAAYGAAIFKSSYSDLHATNNTFDSNIASDAGDLYYWAGDGQPPIMESNTLTQNQPNNLASDPRGFILQDATSYLLNGEENILVLLLVDAFNQTITIQDQSGITGVKVSLAESGYALLSQPTQFVVEDGVAAIQLTASGVFDKEHVFTFESVPSQIVQNITFSFLPCSPGRGVEGTVIPTCVKCKSGTYNVKSDGVCLKCPEGALCEDGGITALANYRVVYVDDGDVEMFQCPSGFCEANQTCALHRIGPLCGDCIKDHVSIGSHCIECTHVNGGMLFACLLALFVFVGVTIVLSGRSSTGVARIIIYFIQMIGYLVNPLSPWVQTSTNTVNFTFINNARFCVIPFDFYGKIGIRFAIPILCLSFIPIYYAAHTLYRYVRQGISLSNTTHKPKYLGSALYLAIFFYMSMATTSLSYVDCDHIGPHYINVNEPGMYCDSSTYRHFSVLVYIVLALYVGLLPIATFCFLVWAWKTQRLHEKHFRQYYGVLFMAYKPEWFWWESVVTLRRIISVAIFVNVQNTDMKLFLLSLICFLASFTHERVQPFKADFDNYLESASLNLLTVFSLCVIAFDGKSLSVPIGVFMFTFIGVTAVYYALFIKKQLLDTYTRVHSLVKNVGNAGSRDQEDQTENGINLESMNEKYT